MTVFAYHTPQVASPINDRRAGTYRIGSDSPDPIQIIKGWDTILYFAFRNHTQRPYLVTGRTVTARIYNTENTEVYNNTLIADALLDGAAHLVMNSTATNALEAGLYSMIIEYTDDYGRTLVAHTSQSRSRHVVEIIDQTTVDLNI